MDLFSYLNPGPTIAEASAYFVGLKKFAAPAVPVAPDTTGMVEGQFPVPVEQVLAVLSQLVKEEFETIYAYHVYAQTLRDLSHDTIAEHFQEHADDELEHADWLLKRMAVLGGPAHVPDVSAPHPSSDPIDIIKTLIGMEQQSVASWQRLLPLVGDNPMKVKVEEYSQAEQDHLDDLWQMLPYTADRAVTLGAKTAQAKLLSAFYKLAEEPNPQAWLAQEQQLQAAQDVNEKDFYKQQAQQAQEHLTMLQQQTQGAQQQMQQMQEQMMQLQQQVDQSATQTQMAMDQSKMMQSASMQSAQEAHAAAAQASMAALEAQREVLRKQQEAVASQVTVQKFRQALMDLAAQDPTQGMGPQPDVPAEAVMQGAVMPGAAGPVAQPNQQAQPESAAPSQDPAQAQVPPPQEAEPKAQTGSPSGKDQSGVSIKVGSPTDVIKSFGRIAADRLGPRLPYGLAGAAVGGLGGLVESKMDYEPLRQKVQDLEARKNELTFAQSFDLMQKRLRLSAGEFAARNPVGSTIGGAVSGSIAGLSMGPEAGEGARVVLERAAGLLRKK